MAHHNVLIKYTFGIADSFSVSKDQGEPYKLDKETWLCRTHLDDILVKVQTILDHIRPYNISYLIFADLLNLFRPIWNILNLFGHTLTHLDQF